VCRTSSFESGTSGPYASIRLRSPQSFNAYASLGWFQSGFNGTQFANKVLVPAQRANALEVGAGVETALDEHWGVRFEYQYGFIQTISNIVAVDVINPNRATVPLRVALHPQVQSAQVGLVYRFNN
jgi:outer membrane autotransporter protein